MYKNVVIAIRDQQMEVTTSDGVGTLVIGKAACTKVAELVECLPYDATLYQGGHKVRIMLKSGTVWLNPTTSSQPLSMFVGPNRPARSARLGDNKARHILFADRNDRSGE